MIGMTYMLNQDVQDGFKRSGMEYFKSNTFWQTYQIGIPQVEHDMNYFFGLLQAATKGRANPYLVHHKKDRNGLAVWMKFEQTYAHGGSKTMKSELLEENLYKAYDPQAYKGIAEYIDHFQTWIEELDALGTRSYQDSDKKRMLIRNLRTDTRLLTLLQICHDDLFREFHETANYLRENGTCLDRTFKKANNQSSKMLNTLREEPEEVEREETTTHSMDSCLKVVQNLIQETTLMRAYNALKMAPVRKSLSIPDEIWAQLEPPLRERINAIRAEVRKKKREQGNAPSNKLPGQYPMLDTQK